MPYLAMKAVFVAALAVFTLASLLTGALPASATETGLSYAVVGTGQHACYSNNQLIPCPQPEQPFYGQDAQFPGNAPSYTDNGDGTITDNVTGLMWVKARGGQMSWDEAMAGAETCRVGGYDDWRMPTIKELYSLIQFTGNTGRTAATSTPYIDTRYFDFTYGDESKGERHIDCQDWSATEYVSSTMRGNATVFGVNFADGRIKGYPKHAFRPGRSADRYVRYVRGNPAYGENSFKDNGDGTITDAATGLTWQQQDSGATMNWQQALAYAENLELAGHDDWRLPSAKELQSIVDYSRSPETSSSPAIDPLFSNSSNEGYYWSSTTHGEHNQVSRAVYVAFGRAMGYMPDPKEKGGKSFMDVHGAGAQRSDPKAGDPARYPQGFGPQGDDIRIYNYVRCVRGGLSQ